MKTLYVRMKYRTGSWLFVEALKRIVLPKGYDKIEIIWI